MPELPEVETVRRGLAPHLEGKRLLGACVREPRLRWPVPEDLNERVCHQVISSLQRRGKYLLFELQGTAPGWLIGHLGMSGSLRLTSSTLTPEKHDHLDLLLEGGKCLRLHDPRRFGALLWSPSPDTHPLIRTLGVEPLDAAFDASLLHSLTRNRKTTIKTLLTNTKSVNNTATAAAATAHSGGCTFKNYSVTETAADANNVAYACLTTYRTTSATGADSYGLVCV